MSAIEADITPDHVPVGLARDILDRVENEGSRARALAVVFLYTTKEGEPALFYESCGHEKRDVLWALENLKKQLLEEDE